MTREWAYYHRQELAERQLDQIKLTKIYTNLQITQDYMD